MKLGKVCKNLPLHGNIDIELCFALDQARDTRDVAPGFIKGGQTAFHSVLKGPEEEGAFCLPMNLKAW